MTEKNPVVLLILDGWGYSEKKEFNAIYSAKTPNFDYLSNNFPSTTLFTSGLEVGLPSGQMGNSEVGHLNIGAGRIVNQEIVRISKSIEAGDFFKNTHFLAAINHVKKTGGKLHLIGLLSDGGVHSHNTHLYALIKMAKENGLKEVHIHAIMDGRDTPPTSGIHYIKELMDYCQEISFGTLTSISGRYYTMDRDNRWDRVEKAYNTLVRKNSFEQFADPLEYMKTSYAAGISDEFIIPANSNKGEISDNDAIIFFNFRADRAREITKAFIEEDFTFFQRTKINNLEYITLTEYKKEFPVKVAFESQTLVNILAEVFEKNNLKNVRIAETEKYAHVTFFFNGGIEKKYECEERVLIPSPKVATYDLKPEMAAMEVKEAIIKALDSEKYSCIIANFANPDMVGHTGIMEAAVKAVETVDKCLGEIFDKTSEKNGVLLVIADHGNAECMVDENGEPMTAHTTNPVPCIIVQKDPSYTLRKNCSLKDIAPTILEFLEIPKPPEMTGSDLRQF